MLLPDVNVLIDAFREDSRHHRQVRPWLEDLINSNEAFALSDLVCSSFIRIVTHPAIFSPPTPIPDALNFLETIRSQPNCVITNPKQRHWATFIGLCTAVGARGALVADAYFAALAIESGSEWVTSDGDYARFPGLRWRRPFENA